MIDDTTFRALADSQRRRLLLSLRLHGPQRIPKLTGESCVVMLATDAFITEYLASSRKSEDVDKALVRMHHVHLPKLADDGFIDWSRETNLVTKGARFDELVPFLELLDTDFVEPVDKETVVIQ